MKTGTPDSGELITVGIVGAGPAGLSMARALKKRGVSYLQYEKHSDVGGIWDIENPGSPMYESAHFISSRDMSGFLDFPMPKSFPDYPSNRDILTYTRQFADHYGLYEHIVFNSEVKKTTYLNGEWHVESTDGRVRRFRYLVCANGVTWHAKMPNWPGRFEGGVRHSQTHKKGSDLQGKRVLVVGLGNSGVDIACDAAIHAREAYVSMRRGYHFIPKHVFGMPTDQFGSMSYGWPLSVRRWVFGLILRLQLGNLRRIGLPSPDHKLFESHPLMNSQLIYHLQHGNIQAKPDIEYLDGSTVVFRDGTRLEVDEIICATGYDMKVPYVDEAYFQWSGGRPQLFMTAFNPRYDSLFSIGLLEVNSSAYTLFDHIAHMIANYIVDACQGNVNTRSALRELMYRPVDLSGGIKLVSSDRHQAYVDLVAFKKRIRQLSKRMGWMPLKAGNFLK